ncbi:DUF262 domain-containing protein [Pseudarthrobacter quantipunctorum]|uniref:DUF262 domain-containing HNH endonuclease family protein n=1 Tax=Pseudarthrobacter quantipunctorum TaxID=3128980 RepID=A0ABZ2R135_9MICC
MPAEPKLTLSTDEVRASGLFTGRNIYDIPYFQRPYKWDSEKTNQLQADVLKLVDGETDVHFLGAIITHQRARANAAQSHVIEVIDGQQRLTTIYLYILAAVKTLIDCDQLDEAKALFMNFIVDGLSTGGGSNLRLHTSHEDRARLNMVVQEVLDTKNFSNHLVGFAFRRLATSDSSSTTKGRSIKNNYAAAKRFFKAQFDQGGSERVAAVYGAILEHLTVVQIEVQDPTNGPKIFDSLNSRQQPMTAGDLIRNDIFARAADNDPSEVDRINTEDWLPFYRGFWIGDKNYFDEYFFPYGLVQNPKLTKSQVYKALRDSWQGKDPRSVVQELAKYQPHFMDLVAGGNRTAHTAPIAERMARLHAAGAPSSVYPFVMRISSGVADHLLDEGKAAEVLDVVDAFLTRRAICGIEPTGLHAVFKGLWNECGGEVTAERVVQIIRNHRTVAWPSDDDVRRDVASRPLFGTSIVKYVVREYDRSLGGDKHNTVAHLEHVLPQKSTALWPFSKDEHGELSNLLANLLPLSANMNSSIGNEPYAKKRVRYSADSVFKSVREFADLNTEWTPKDLRVRSKVMADWAVKRWPSYRT